MVVLKPWPRAPRDGFSSAHEQARSRHEGHGARPAHAPEGSFSPTQRYGVAHQQIWTSTTTHHPNGPTRGLVAETSPATKNQLSKNFNKIALTCWWVSLVIDRVAFMWAPGGTTPSHTSAGRSAGCRVSHWRVIAHCDCHSPSGVFNLQKPNVNQFTKENSGNLRYRSAKITARCRLYESISSSALFY